MHRARRCVLLVHAPTKYSLKTGAGGVRRVRRQGDRDGVPAMRRDIPALLLWTSLSRHRPSQPTFGPSARPSAAPRLGARCAELRQKVRGFDARPVRHGLSMKNRGGPGSSRASRPPHRRARFQASDAQQEPFVKRGPADMSWLRSICEWECNSSRARGVRFHGSGSYLTGRGSLFGFNRQKQLGERPKASVSNLPSRTPARCALFATLPTRMWHSYGPTARLGTLRRLGVR